MSDELRHQIEERGWALVDLSAPAAVFQVAYHLMARIGGSLARYSQPDHEEHEQMQADLTADLRTQNTLARMLARQASLLEQIVGPDFLIQQTPYLRIARPGVERDNAGYHRDTDYGATPDEYSVWVPFVDLPAEGSLEVADGSHRRYIPEPVALAEGATGVTRGSRRHALGFPYAPRVLPPEALEGLHGVPIRVGQALIFSLALVHGTVCNRSTVTRWSADIRVAPASFADQARPGYYLPLSEVRHA
jgi:ectoine hydroxylase-related dioxygenase (phytanoyl-CoA dioxygenase family)